MLINEFHTYNMELLEVKSKAQINDFLDVVDLVNASASNYISALKLNTKNALDKKKNPFWKEAEYKLFVIYKKQKPVGRIAAIYSKKHQEIHKNNWGYFGYFDCINDLDFAEELISSAKSFLLELGCKKMVGPLNPSVNYELGVLVSGFDKPPFFMMNYNLPFYRKILLELGAKEEMKFNAYHLPINIKREKIDRIVSLITKKYSIRVENINFSIFEKEAENLYKIYNDAFEGHWGYLPFTKKEFIFMANDMKFIMDKDLVYKIYVKDECAGFILALPNLNEAVQKLKNGRLSLWGGLKLLYYKRKIKWVKVMVVAIKKKYQNYGLGSILYAEMADRVARNNYLGGELSWVANDNVKMKKVIESMGATVSKKYTVFGFSLV